MKTKKKVTPLLTEGEAIATMQEYARNTSQLKKIEAQMELEMQLIRDKFSRDIDAYQAIVRGNAEALIYFAEFNKKKLFNEGKTVDLQFGSISLRLGTPKVDKLRSLTWDAAVEKVRKINEDFVRTTCEVDKAAIIAARDDEKMMEKLSKIGISVVQEEAITITSKQEELVDA